MKNYLIKGLHRIISPVWWPGSDRSHEETIDGDLHWHYEQMARLSEASFFQNLQGDWEYIKLESTAADVNHVFRQQFRAIWDIWSTEPCNIYYCGSDVQGDTRTLEIDCDAFFPDDLGHLDYPFADLLDAMAALVPFS